MEKSREEEAGGGGGEGYAMGLRHQNLKKSFKLAVRGLLTTCSKEEFCKAFPTFTQAEQAYLNRLYIEIIASLHQNIEDEFESLCHETKAGDILDTVEELVEEQNLDPLFSDKTNFKDVVQSLSTAKKDEIQYLKTSLEKAEQQNEALRCQVELLKKERRDFSGASNAVEKMKTAMVNIGMCNANDP